MARPILDTHFFTNPIPKSSKFIKGDWILKYYGQHSNKIAQIIGYRSGYYGGGSYLIEFEDGTRLKTKPKYFRGPYKTKEIAKHFAQNPNLEEKPEDLRLKQTDIRTEYKTLPKLEKTLKEIYTKEPYNFEWLEKPVTFRSSQYEKEMITVLATRKDSSYIADSDFRGNVAFTKQGFGPFCIFRLNDPLTKKLITRDYSAYQISYPEVITFPSKQWNFNEETKKQIHKIFKVKQSSHTKIIREPLNLEPKFANFNRLLHSDKLEMRDLVELCGNLQIKEGKKFITNFFNEKIGVTDTSLIKDYHLTQPFYFDEKEASNLNNCPLSTPGLTVLGDKLKNLSTDNNTSVKEIQILHAPLIKNLNGLETFTGVETVTVGAKYGSSSHILNLESLEGCPENVKLTVSKVGEKPTLKGLPNKLKSLDINIQLDQFDCRNVVIEGKLSVWIEPKSLKGLPKASSYHIVGKSDQQIENEITIGKLEDEFPEIAGTFGI